MPRSRLIAIAIVAIVAVGIGGFIVYDQVLRGDSAAALTLPTASPAGQAPAATADAGANGSAAPATSDGTVAGTWTVAADSVAGYRVREQLANLPAESDAVGRTDQVTGSITIEGSGRHDVADRGLAVRRHDLDRVGQVDARQPAAQRGLQTDSFPTATFKLTAPVAVPAAALAGTASDVTLTGDLTLHGVTKSVSIPAKAQLVNGVISVAGSLGFPLSDYSITAPNIGGFIVSIADTGTLEFLVNFTKA